MNKSKFATVFLSIVPGVGHLYLGWQERGLQFMVGFFFTIFLIGWLQIPLFGFLLPVIWFYSLFDALQCLSNGNSPQESRSPLFWVAEKQRWVGIGLIALGGLILFNRIVLPLLRIYLDYRILSMITPALVALIFIAGGVKLALGKRLPSRPENKTTLQDLHQRGDEH